MHSIGPVSRRNPPPDTTRLAFLAACTLPCTRYPDRQQPPCACSPIGIQCRTTTLPVVPNAIVEMNITHTDHSQLTHITVHNPRGKDFSFIGVKLGEISHGHIGTIEVFKTKAGKWIASQRSNGIRPRPQLHRAAVLDTEDDLIQWLGSSEPAKRLATQMGLSVTQEIE